MSGKMCKGGFYKEINIQAHNDASRMDVSLLWQDTGSRTHAHLEMLKDT